ncbi:MAG TPA: surface-adhesin E family protein [Candidatus Binatia bacterium]|nr:surface-adhesin E family protein [Candidatus Binatia bacterium]
MRSVVMAVVLGFLAVPAQAQQQFTTIGTTVEGTTIQVGPRSASPNGPTFVAMDSVEIYAAPRMLPDGRAYAAMLYHNDFDCSTRRFRVPSLIYFADAELHREILWDPVHTDWQRPDAGSVGERLVREVCG